MERGPIRRGLTRLYDSANALLLGKEMWLGIPAALAVLAVVWVAVQGWFQTQPLIVQFEATASAFLFLSVGTAWMVRRVVRAWRTLDVVVSVGQVEVHAGGNEHHCGYVGLRDVSITTRERRGLSVQLFAVWRSADGRERRAPSPGFGRTHWLLNDQQPTLADEDVRFFLGYSEEAYNDPSLKGPETVEVGKATPYLVIRAHVSGKEKRLPLVSGRPIRAHDA